MTPHVDIPTLIHVLLSPLLAPVRAWAVAKWGDLAGHVVDAIGAMFSVWLAAAGHSVWDWWRSPETQRQLRRRLRTALLLGMLYNAERPHSLPCGCPSWKAEVFDVIGHKVERVLQVDPAEGWADVHRTDERGKPASTPEGTPLVERVEGFFRVRCPVHPERLLT